MIIHDPIDAYLARSHYIDADAPDIRAKAAELAAGAADETDLARRAYLFVRDEIKHSWDVQDRRVTVTASDALRQGVGICWAKANLLAALCRASGIPAGVCYQRLTLGDGPERGYCIHALNGIYLQSLGRWVRVDARGNKPGVEADFSLEEEKLAFPVRPALGEMDYGVLYAEPLPRLMEILERSTDALWLYEHDLPESI